MESQLAEKNFAARLDLRSQMWEAWVVYRCSTCVHTIECLLVDKVTVWVQDYLNLTLSIGRSPSALYLFPRASGEVHSQRYCARFRERATNVDGGQMLSMVAEAISTRKIGSTLVLTWVLVNQKAFGQYSWSLLGGIKSDFCSAPVAAPFVSFKPRRKGGACAQPTIAKCLVETRDSVTVGQVETRKTAPMFFLGLQGCAGRFCFLFFPVFCIWRRFSPKRKGIYGTSEVQVIFIFSPCEVASSLDASA